jgi:hypothetical protein
MAAVVSTSKTLGTTGETICTVSRGKNAEIRARALGEGLLSPEFYRSAGEPTAPAFVKVIESKIAQG